MNTGKYKLKPKEVREFREALLKKQEWLCALCGKIVQLSEATLDHCHDTGHVRAVLHRNCNSIEGRIRHWANRSGIDPVQFLEAVLDHWGKQYDHLPLHPKHKNAIEKEIVRLKRRRKRLKTHKAKLRYTKKIKELEALNVR